MVDLFHRAGGKSRSQLDVVQPAGFQRRIGHPHDVGIEAVAHLRLVLHFDQHIAATDVDFIGQGEGDRLIDIGFFKVAIEGNDFLDRACAPGGQGHDLLTRADHAGGDSAAEAPEVEVRAVDVLNRKPEVLQVLVPAYFYSLQDFHQRLAGEPGRVLALVHHVVAFQGGQRDEADILQAQLGGKGQIIIFDFVEAFFAEIHQVHLVYGHDNVANALQRRDVGMATGLGQHAVAGIDHQDRDLRGGCAGGHVPGVLFMARGVSDDELALVGGEIPVGHVNRDALFPLRLQAVHQKGEVQLLAGSTHLGAVGFQAGHVIFVDHLGVMEQAADQGALAVIHAAAGEQAQELLVFVLLQVGLNIFCNQIRLV